jgi:hypothetical protein
MINIVYYREGLSRVANEKIRMVVKFIILPAVPEPQSAGTKL